MHVCSRAAAVKTVHLIEWMQTLRAISRPGIPAQPPACPASIGISVLRGLYVNIHLSAFLESRPIHRIRFALSRSAQETGVDVGDDAVVVLPPQGDLKACCISGDYFRYSIHDIALQGRNCSFRLRFWGPTIFCHWVTMPLPVMHTHTSPATHTRFPQTKEFSGLDVILRAYGLLLFVIETVRSE